MALIVVTGTEGGAVRAPGAMMAVSEGGEYAGYLSGGCIDADLILQAQAALNEHAPRHLRYGTGSPFFDIALPCGGAIEVQILPCPDRFVLKTLCTQLSDRKPATLSISEEGQISADPENDARFVFHYRPNLHLRLAGRGADFLALARLAIASGYSCKALSPDEACLCDLQSSDLLHTTKLSTPSHLPTNNDDPWTAFVLMFHDGDWETPLLMDALGGNAFYIGAVGSAKTHARRCNELLNHKVSQTNIERIHGPIGLIPSMREASMLAISALAEVVAAYNEGQAQ